MKYRRERGLTIRSTGHFVASGSWASFHSRPTAAHRKMPVSFNVRQHPMQTIPAPVFFASTAGFASPAPSTFHRFDASAPALSGGPAIKPSNSPVASFNGVGSSALAMRCVLQQGQSASAVRLSERSEILLRRAKLVRCSRFAPAAQPPVS